MTMLRIKEMMKMKNLIRMMKIIEKMNMMKIQKKKENGDNANMMKNLISRGGRLPLVSLNIASR